MKLRLSFPAGTTLQNGALLEVEKMAHFLRQYKMAHSSRQYKMVLSSRQYKMAHSLRPYKMAHFLKQYTDFSKVLFSFKMSCVFTIPRRCSLRYDHKNYSLPCADFPENHTGSTIFCTDVLCPYYSSTDSINIDTRSHTHRRTDYFHIRRASLA